MGNAFRTEPYWETVDSKSQAKAIREAINKGVRNPDPSSNVLMSEMVSDMVEPDGGLRYADFEPGVDISEMIDTAQGQMALLEKVRIDVAFGLAEIPLLYGPLYERIAPAGGFPGGVYQIDENTLGANVVFLEKFEGGEVQFGSIEKAAPTTGAIQTYAAGFVWTEDMIEFDRTWQIEMNNRAFGRAFNALLNHLHFSPIIGYSYGGGNSTAADTTSGASLQERTHLTFQAAYREAVMASPRRTPTVLLASEADRFQIEDALLTPVRDEQGNAMPNVPIGTIIYYDGEELKRGSDVYEYAGVTGGTCFLVMPGRKLKELVHHDLRIDIGPPQLSRLIEGDQVGRARRGLYANLAESVEKITLPT